jgi:hypothetical protein
MRGTMRKWMCSSLVHSVVVHSERADTLDPSATRVKFVTVRGDRRGRDKRGGAGSMASWPSDPPVVPRTGGLSQNGKMLWSNNLSDRGFATANPVEARSAPRGRCGRRTRSAVAS